MGGSRRETSSEQCVAFTVELMSSNDLESGVSVYESTASHINVSVFRTIKQVISAGVQFLFISAVL